MCGISVLVNTKNAPVENSLIQNMNARITHRGPDNGDVYHGGNFALGHRRLSILDTGHLAHQPLQFGDYIITYNGEIYNHYEIRKKLLEKGFTFSTRSDTEVIMAAYDSWGTECVSLFEGMWAFVIYDIRKNIFFGSRDRFGQKPFHYGKCGNFFVMASEVKQFMEVPAFKARLNQEAAFNFLNYGALNYSNDLFFEGVQSLGAGCNMVYDLSTHQYNVSQWYNFPRAYEKNIDIHEAAERFRELFTQSVSLRMNSDVSMGSCLSGGLDSSSIVCIMNDVLNGKEVFHTLSICWNDPEIDEREYIDIVSAHTASVNKKIFPDMNELSEGAILEKIIYHQDQPIPSASHFAEYKVYEAAARYGLKVMMDGQGADEYLGGYGLFNWYHLHGLLSENRFVSLSQEWSAVRKSENFTDNEMLKIFLYVKYKQRRPRLKPVMDVQWSKDFLNGNPTLPGPDTKLSARDLSYHQLFRSSLPYQLHSADRNSMCHSIESRLPFLDHNLVEFSYSLPDTFKISKGMSKVILRKALSNILPRRIQERTKKLGFPAPERQWMLNNKKWISKAFDANADVLSKFIAPSKLKNDFDQFSNSGLQDHSPFFRILSFSSWLKMFNVSFVQFVVICLWC